MSGLLLPAFSVFRMPAHGQQVWISMGPRGEDIRDGVGSDKDDSVYRVVLYVHLCITRMCDLSVVYICVIVLTTDYMC